MKGSLINSAESITATWKLLKTEKYLIPIYKTFEEQPGDSVCFINPELDTIVPFGKYTACGYQNVIKHFGAVMGEINGKTVCIAIDNEGNELFEIYWFENGPDYLEDGRFRIIKDGKIGYADAYGNIIITPQYECADFFRKGMAKVTYSCELIPEGEYKTMKSSTWFYIDVNGNEVKPDN